jgi:hypothetical protein
MPTLETETDYYALLGVDPGADAVTIRKAVVGEQRRWGARQNSPELATRQAAERYAQLLTEVRDVLLDPGRRALYDIRLVEALPTWPALQPAARTPGNWFRPTAALALTLAVVVFLASRSSPGTSEAGWATAVEMPRVATASVETPVPVPLGVAPTRPRVSPTEPPAPTATRPPTVARALPDEVPVTLSGTPLFTSIVPPPTQPFSLAGGHYNLAWAVAGRQPCDFVITIADPVAPALVRTTLSNHILNRSDGQPALGQTSVNLNAGKYRLEAWSDTCLWTLTLSAG